MVASEATFVTICPTATGAPKPAVAAVVMAALIAVPTTCEMASRTNSYTPCMRVDAISRPELTAFAHVPIDDTESATRCPCAP
ncbi:hypothetical protein DBR36_00225 [Microbacterium sp. HMWF026]|nr:hypothetical protein DBR36_00225 [Microbacterium sp. HMWF026]